ncbi:hypothetical protein IKE87_00525 [Candidatus Saccharibacteria bacterium]|nr:hypothetical protein [Candidatus Saccharibacteria bacterium]
MSERRIKQASLGATIYNIYSKISHQSSKSTSSKKSRNKRDIISAPPYSEFPAATSTFSGLAILFSLFLGFLGVSNTYASSISISLTGNVNLNILKDNTNPTFGKSTTQTATVTSDHFTGYTLTIAGSNDTGRLVGSNDSTKYLSSITTPLTESQFNTDAHNDQWGFLPSKLNSITNNSYQPSPTATTPTTIDVTNSPTTGENYTLALAARVSSNMSLDSYGQTFVLAATGNGYDYHIGYTDNMTTIPKDQYATSAAEGTVQLSSTIPTKAGFVFRGWCSQETSVDIINGTTCPNGATVYQPGATITLDGTSANNLLLYAIWDKGYNTFADAFAAFNKEKSGDYYQMQDMTPEICDSIVIGSPYTTADIAKNTLIDTRNSKTYLVAKYADGHCWMRENLNYVFTAGGTVVAYNFQTGETFNYTTTYATQTETDTPWAEDASDGARSFKRDEDLCIGGTDINTSGGTGATCDASRPYERIGVLYNWAAATAQTKDDNPQDKTSEVTTSICPKGWRLPSIGGDYSFSTLMGSYSLPTTNQSQGYSGQLQNPLNFNRPGNYNWSNGALYYRGTGGYFWSSVGYSSAGAYDLGFYSSYFDPQSGSNKGNGLSVRCVAV